MGGKVLQRERQRERERERTNKSPMEKYSYIYYYEASIPKHPRESIMAPGRYYFAGSRKQREIN